MFFFELHKTIYKKAIRVTAENTGDFTAELVEFNNEDGSWRQVTVSPGLKRLPTKEEMTSRLKRMYELEGFQEVTLKKGDLVKHRSLHDKKGYIVEIKGNDLIIAADKNDPMFVQKLKKRDARLISR